MAKHKWKLPERYAAGECQASCDETWRRCMRCGLIKITVKPPEGFPWLEWERPPMLPRFKSELTPPCEVK